MRRYFSFLYYRPARELRKRSFQSQCHKIRDGIVHMELSPLLHAAGFQYGGALLNPPKTLLRDTQSFASRAQRFRDGDIVVLGTRPPLSEEGKRTLDTSGLEIEKEVLERISTVLVVCSRTRVEIATSVGIRDEYRALNFHQTNGARVRRRPASKIPFTVGYSIWLPPVRGTPWGLFVAFGLGGAESALFAHLLRTRFAAAVQAMLASPVPRFFMLQYSQPQRVPYPSMTYPLGDCETRILADREIVGTKR